VARGSYKKPGGYKDGIRGKGYIVNALEATLWAFWSDQDPSNYGVLAAVNLGDDTDTTAAIYSQFAGPYYGYQNIPKKMVEQTLCRKELFCIGQWLHFEGSQYKGPKKEKKAVSTAPNADQASLTHHKGKYVVGRHIILSMVTYEKKG
jgi:hypothetical protein